MFATIVLTSLYKQVLKHVTNFNSQILGVSLPNWTFTPQLSGILNYQYVIVRGRKVICICLLSKLWF
jgi:hypothetical protein